MEFVNGYGSDEAVDADAPAQPSGADRAVTSTTIAVRAAPDVQVCPRSMRALRSI